MKTSRWLALFWISISVLFALSLWFSASAIVPELKTVWNLSSIMEAWVTASVQIGFIVGTLFSAYFSIPDRYNSRNIFSVSALLGSVFNLTLIFADQAFLGIILRFLQEWHWLVFIQRRSNLFPSGSPTGVGSL